MARQPMSYVEVKADKVADTSSATLHVQMDGWKFQLHLDLGGWPTGNETAEDGYCKRFAEALAYLNSIKDTHPELK